MTDEKKEILDKLEFYFESGSDPDELQPIISKLIAIAIEDAYDAGGDGF